MFQSRCLQNTTKYIIKEGIDTILNLTRSILKPRIQCKRQFPRFAKPMWCIAIIYHKMKPQGWLGNALRGRNSRAYLLAPAAHCGETGLLRVILWTLYYNIDKIFCKISCNIFIVQYYRNFKAFFFFLWKKVSLKNTHSMGCL